MAGKKILFICTGNTCRSSMATFLARRLQEKEFPQGTHLFDSAGLMAVAGMPASSQAIAALAELGIDLLPHRTKPFRPDMVDKADLVLAMTAAHRQWILDRLPTAAGKVFTLGEFAGLEGKDIRDPFGGSREQYVATRDDLSAVLLEMLKKLEKAQES